jgi:ferritin-like metal-binding protein YciE
MIIVGNKDSLGSDAGLIAAAQTIEHYEIACFFTFGSRTRELGITNPVKLLEYTLAEEKNTDDALTEIALAPASQKTEAT